MRRYAITEGLGANRALAFIACNLERGVEMIQIREKELPVEELRSLVERAMALPNPHRTRIFVNGRADLGGNGVHLPAGVMWKRDKFKDVPRGVSCHTVEEVRAAELDGAEFAVFGPVFASSDKTPVGLAALREAASAVRISVYALGGVTEENAAECIAAGAAGIAGIRLFRP